jgi:hypothetical protein
MEAEMEKKFRKYIGQFEFWHFQKNCADWPQGNYINRSRLSPRSRVCPKCLYLAEKQAQKQSSKSAESGRDIATADNRVASV